MVSGASSAISLPSEINASVASTPGPPALVTIVKRGPLGRGCFASTWDILNRSEISLTRSTPQRRNAASSTSSEPVNDPVCVAAARLPASVRPGLMTIIGLFNATSRAAGKKSPSLADAFHVDHNAVRLRIIAQILNQIAPPHVQHG